MREVRLNTPVIGVRRTLNGKVVVKDHQQREETYDHVIFACHGDQAYRLLTDRTPIETDVLRHITYKRNRAIVHRDKAVRPCSHPAHATCPPTPLDPRAHARGTLPTPARLDPRPRVLTPPPAPRSTPPPPS